MDLNLNDDLSSVVVTCIEQDQLGFIWFGTNNGLYRYDGFEFRTYLTDKSRHTLINESHVHFLYSDRYGKLWITMNSLLCCYDIYNDSISIVSSQYEGRGLENPFVSCYIETSDSTFFVTANDAVYQYDRENNQFLKLFSIEGNEINSLCFDDKNNLWIGSPVNEGVFYHNFNTGLTKKLDFSESKINTFPVTDVEMYQNLLWIATNGGGITSYDPVSSRFKHYPPDSEYALNIRNLYLDRDSIMWIIDFTGLKQYIHDQDYFHGFYPESNKKYSISPYLNYFFQDRDRNYWSLHTPGGVRFSPRPKGFTRFDSNVNSPFRLTIDAISAISEDVHGNLWLGNPFNGIDVFYWSKGGTVTFLYDANDLASLGKGAIHVIFQDSETNMWAGSYWGGLQMFLPQTGKFKSFLHNPADPGSISSNDIRSICEDHDGNLWMCSHGKGVDKLDKKTGKFINYNTKNNNLSNDYTFDILCSSSGTIWVGTVWGLSRLSSGDSLFQNYLFDRVDSTTISSNVVNDVFEDRLKRIWVGTPDGLNLYLPQNDCFVRYTEGFVNRNIVSVMDDDNHHLWLGTYNGLVRFDPETGLILQISDQDGIISNSFKERAVFNNGLNTLFYGSDHGLTYFNPDKLKFNSAPPDVFITKIVLQNEVVQSRKSRYLKKNILLTDTLKLEHTQKKITFFFTSTDYLSCQKNRYAYLLEGFENEWTVIEDKHELTYTNLNSGTYTFHIKAANREGIWNEQGTSITLIISSPFWQSVWFRIILIAVLFLIMIGVIKVREERMIRVQTELENKIADRTREILSQKEALEKQKLELEDANNLKNRFFNVLAHDLKSPVNSLVQLTGLLNERISQQPERELDKLSGMAAQTAYEMNRLLEDLLIWGKAQSKNMYLTFENLHLQEIVSTMIEYYQHMASSKQIEVVMNIPTDVVAYADINSLKVILRNLLSNAIKFSHPGSQVTIIAERTDDHKIMVIVSDQGIGIPDEKKQHIFEPKTYQSTRGTAGEKGNGLGLSLCYELVQQNGGEIWVESETGKGSRFFFTLPAPDK